MTVSLHIAFHPWHCQWNTVRYLRAINFSNSVGGRIHSGDYRQLLNGDTIGGWNYCLFTRKWSKPKPEYQATCRENYEVCGTKCELWYLVRNRSYAVLPCPLYKITITMREQWIWKHSSAWALVTTLSHGEHIELELRCPQVKHDFYSSVYCTSQPFVSQNIYILEPVQTNLWRTGTSVFKNLKYTYSKAVRWETRD